jgi:translation initiation factor IF-2
VAKVRVYELAKELGVESKTLLNHLKEQGEFVRSASSTIEPPVVRKIKETFPAELRGGGDGKAAEAKPAAKPAARKPAAQPETPAAPQAPAAPAAKAPEAPAEKKKDEGWD